MNVTRRRQRVLGSLYPKKLYRRSGVFIKKSCNISDEGCVENDTKNGRKSVLSDVEMEVEELECYFKERGASRGEALMSPHLFSIQEKCLNSYLRCKVETWKYPTSPRDKVQLEPLPTDFLPRIKTSPMLIPVVRHGYPIKYVQRVCGYRELYKKRMYIEYLKDLEEEKLLMKRSLQRRFSVINKCVLIDILGSEDADATTDD